MVLVEQMQSEILQLTIAAVFLPDKIAELIGLYDKHACYFHVSLLPTFKV